jgi:hypothetical protein
MGLLFETEATAGVLGVSSQRFTCRGGGRGWGAWRGGAGRGANTTETAVVEKPENEPGHDHHHGHAH